MWRWGKRFRPDPSAEIGIHVFVTDSLRLSDHSIAVLGVEPQTSGHAWILPMVGNHAGKQCQKGEVEVVSLNRSDRGSAEPQSTRFT